MSSNDRITCKLDDILEKTIDNRGKNPPFSISGFPYIDTTCIVGNSRHPDYSLIRKYVSGETYRNWFRSGHPQKGDLLIATVGANIGQICLMDETIACVAQNTIGLRVNRKKVNPHYIYYLLSSRAYQDYLKSLDVGSAQPSIKVPHLLGINVEVPSLNIQNKIVDTFSILDDKIELNIQMNKTLEAIGQALFKHWFVDFDFPDEEGKPHKSSGGEMVDSELGEMPKGWKIGELTEFLDFLEGPGIRNWQYTLGGTRFINIRLIKNNDIDIANANYVSNEEAYGKYKHFLLEEKDMIVSTSGTLGRTAIVRKKHLPLMLNTSVIRFRPIDAESYPFMYQYLNSSLFYNELRSLASGSVQLNFGPMHLKSMKMLMPAKEILNLYNKSVSCVYDKIVSNLDKSDILSHLRDSLLPRLMSGRIRVRINL